MENLYTVDGPSVDLHFHSGQLRAWESTRRFIAVLAGTQSGKTSFGPWWLYREIMRCGQGDYLAVTSTYDLFKLKMLPSMMEVLTRVLKVGRFWGVDRVFEIADPTTGQFWAKRSDDPMWARIILRSAESPGGLEATTAKAAWLDEAGQPQFDVLIWESVLRRLSLEMGRALLTTTVYNLGFLKKNVYDRWVAGDKNFDVIQFDSTENPRFPPEEAKRAKASMPLWRYNMQYRGLFERPAGLIYDCFDESRHSIPRFYIPDDWPRGLGLDFGGVNTAGTFYAQKPGTRKLYLYRTYKAGGRTATEHTHELLKGEPGIPDCVGGSKSEGQWRQEFRQGGILMVNGRAVPVPGLPIRGPAIKEVEVGINRVYGAIKRGELYVFDDLDDFLQEIRAYSRKLDTSGDPTEEIDEKETYHFCFVAGTLIATDHGLIPIERVEIGMQAMTRAGFRPIIDAGATGFRLTTEVEFSGGGTLRGTSDHPIFIKGRGLIPIGSLRYNDATYLLEENPRWSSIESSTASGITDTPMLNANLIGSISNDKASTCIERSGSSTTARFRRSITSIIWTRIRATTQSRTWLSSPKASIFQSITRFLLSGRRGSRSTSFLSRLSGTEARRGEPGIAKILPRRWRNEFLSQGHANGAERSTRRRCSAINLDSVQTRARQQTVAHEGSTTSTSLASNAAASSGEESISSPSGAVLGTVRALRERLPATVYNLTVESEHEYYANGILVSNCDSMRYYLGWKCDETKMLVDDAPLSELVDEDLAEQDRAAKAAEIEQERRRVAMLEDEAIWG